MLFNRRLPSSYRAISGYFYNEESECSPQVDIMICQQHEMHGLGPGNYGGAFTPFSSVRVIGEVKKSSYSVSAAFGQLSERLESWRQMQARSQEIMPGSRTYIEQPLSFMFFADTKSITLKKIKAIYGKPGIKPDYVVLLDKGLLIASYNSLFKIDDGALAFHERRLAGEWAIHRPSEQDRSQGRLLLWLYFAISAALHLSEGNTASHVTFTNVAELRYRLKAAATLANATEWPLSTKPGG